MVPGPVRGAVCGLLLGVAAVAFGAENRDARTPEPATASILPFPVSVGDTSKAVSAIQRLRLHPGRDCLSPDEAARNRPPADDADAARR